MNPFVKQMRQLEQLLRDRINAATGQDIEIKLLDTGEAQDPREAAPTIDLKQMEMVKEYLANMFTQQFGQQKNILDLELAYEDKNADEKKGSFGETQMMDVVLTKDVDYDEEEGWYGEQEDSEEGNIAENQDFEESQEEQVQQLDDLPPLV